MATPGTLNRECDWREWSEPSRFAAERDFSLAGIAWSGLLALAVFYVSIVHVEPAISRWNVVAVMALVYTCFLLFLMSRPRKTARLEITPTEARYVIGSNSFAVETGSVTGVEPYEGPPSGTDDYSADWDVQLVLRDGEKKELRLYSSESRARSRAARLGEAFASLQPAKTSSSLGDGT